MSDATVQRPLLQFAVVQSLFLQALGVIYLIAFGSFAVQCTGLVGINGIQPANLYLTHVFQATGTTGYRLVPTVLWLSSTDLGILAVCIAGVISALFVLFNFGRRMALTAAFLLYLSLVSASQEFLSFQWDFLLLETGFLAIFLGYSPLVIVLFRWLLFRLLFFSGVVKLTSGDPTWRHLTALTFHYWTQPIPTPLAWYANQMPGWFQQSSCAGVFAIELLVPFFALGPRAARLFAVPWLLALQILILLTGNYAFFNLLAIVLCIFLLDDSLLAAIVPQKWMARARQPQRILVPHSARQWIAGSVAVLIGVLSVLLALQSLEVRLPSPVRTLLAATAPFGIVNSYGLFAVMTTKRPEIIVEGSADGTDWRSYEFKYKAGPLNRRPPWVAPHQPRLDWQMWFAALGSYRENVWFLNFLARLLQGRPEVLALLDRNPFPEKPPRYVRARLYEYRFTDWAARRSTGEWWTRTPDGLYLPPVSLDMLSGLPVLSNPNRRE